MTNTVSLKVKCPLCSASLMDDEHKIDNEPGIKLEIAIGDKKGHIWLSSIYESYNHETNIEVHKGSVAIFSCPHCHGQITSREKCEACDAPLVPFHLEQGGKVTICSRAGCKKHSIAFEDLSTALGTFYDQFSYMNSSQTPVPKSKPAFQSVSEKEGDKEIIKTGSFLNSYCPHCRHSLIEDRMVKLKVSNEKGENGFLLLNPYLNFFTHKSTIRLPEHHPAHSIRCPHCERALFVEEKKCPVCNSGIIWMQVAAMTKMIDFYICSNQGCTWHGLSDADIQSIVLEDSKI